MSVPRSSKRMDVRLKRAYEPAAVSDGKSADRPPLAAGHQARCGAPGRMGARTGAERRAAPLVRPRPRPFEEFRRRYTAELSGQDEKLRELRRRARGGPLTLVYAAHDEEHNDAVVLAQILRSGRRSR